MLCGICTLLDIEKPFALSQVENLLRDALHFKTQKEKDAMMFFRKDGILYPVKCNRVIYMELIKRKICIHMKNGDVLSIPNVVCAVVKARSSC